MCSVCFCLLNYWISSKSLCIVCLLDSSINGFIKLLCGIGNTWPCYSTMFKASLWRPWIIISWIQITRRLHSRCIEERMTQLTLVTSEWLHAMRCATWLDLIADWTHETARAISSLTVVSDRWNLGSLGRLIYKAMG